jgi:rhamnose transport system ATP-binding protein
MALLQALGISKAYGGVRALRQANFELLAGEVHALVGENGAGKSTLVKVFTGAVQPDGGEIRGGTATFRGMTPAQAKEIGIAAIYQQPSLFPQLSVAENIGLALEPLDSLRRIDWSERRRRAVELLTRIGADIHPDQDAASLSLPQQQMLEIAKALGARATVFIMDEPTASLSGRETEQLFKIISELRAGGAGIIYISHRLEEIGRISDRVTVLRDGETVATHLTRELDQPAIIRLMVGRDIAAAYPKHESAAGDVVLELHDVSSAAAGVQHISLTVRSGEIVGLAGLVGAGRTELAGTIFGLTPADQGEISLRGRTVRIDSPETAIRNGIAYVPEDRRKHGLVEGMTVAENTTLASLGAVSRAGLIDFSKERELASRFVAKLATKTPGVDVAVNTLSGGNQQKVVLSRWMAISPSVLILDEPTQGIDVGAKAEVHRLVNDMAAQGMAILIISSELPEILGLSDRIAVMTEGTMAGILDRAEATQERVLALALPRKDALQEAAG